jgi:hypothetical protein
MKNDEKVYVQLKNLQQQVGEWVGESMKKRASHTKV